MIITATFDCSAAPLSDQGVRASRPLQPRGQPRGPAIKKYEDVTMCMCDTGVCEKVTPPEKKTRGNISLKNIRSGAAEDFMLLSYKAQARVKGVCCS